MMEARAGRGPAPLRDLFLDLDVQDPHAPRRESNAS
jgi:hypothetical protein